MFDRFRAASPTRQIQLIVAAVCVFALLLTAVWYGFLRTTYQPLFGDLRPADAATIVSALERKKIPYRLADGGRVILVPEDTVDATRLDIMSDDIPLKGTVGFELFNKSDMGLTDFAQKINYQRALQGELERTIMTLDGVDTARVHLSLGEDRLFRDDRVPPKASVTVHMAKGAVLSQSAAQGVKRLVAAAVPNLDVANVVILDAEGDMVAADPAPAAGAVAPLLEEKRAVEEYYEARIREALDAAKLPTAIAVHVVAEAIPDAATADWSPAARDFPLQVTLSPARPLDPALQDGIHATAATAIASTTAQVDAITFGAAPPPGAVPLPERLPLVRAPAPPPAALDSGVPDEQHDLMIAAGFALLLVLGVIAAFVLLLRGLRGPRRLSARRRSDFVAKLRAVLDEGETRVAPQP